MRLRLAALPIVILIVAACPATSLPSPSPSIPPRPPPSEDGPATASPSALPAAEHRIGVRVAGGNGEFFDRTTGDRFVPRGANLVRLSGGSHSTLDVGRYDPAATDATLAAMADLGYNTVRLFLNSRAGGMPGVGEPLSPAYLDNAADFLARASAHDLVVVFTQDWLPESPDWAFQTDPLVEDVNSMYLSRGGVEVNERFFRSWAQGLVDRGAALDALLAYELRNELYFTDTAPPFSITAGEVTAPNGRSYDVSNPTQRRALLEDGVVHWGDRMRAAILEVDPTALVAIGFFQPHGPNPSRAGDDRLIETREVIARSTLDFIDLHGYPGGELDLAEIVENFALPPQTAKPILLGEFGAEHGAFATVDDAVAALVGWQLDSCSFGFDGWLSWTWDSHEQPEFWTAVDTDGAIATALAPATRPDPCDAGPVVLPLELAAGATATASAALAGEPATNAIDGKPDTTWIAGDGPVQWIELDLGEARTVAAIRLLVAQSPPGPTTHRVLIADGGTFKVLETLAGATADGDWLEVRPPEPLDGVRRVRIETTASPSWVAWREISVVGVRP